MFPAGIGGLVLAEINMKMSDPLTPAEMFWLIIQRFRGFASSSGGDADASRLKPATLPPVSKNGQEVGKGFETFAGIQVLDKNGKRVGLAADFFDKGGPENHGEARAIGGLRRSGAIQAEGGKLIVVVEKNPCPHCERRLLDFAKENKIPKIEVHLPTRQSMTTANAVTAKVASRTSFMAGRPNLKVELHRTIDVPKLSPTSGGGGPGSPRSSVKGKIAKFTAGAVLSVALEATKQKIKDDLANLARPVRDVRSASAFFKDPAAAKGMTLLDVLGKDTDILNRELGQHADTVVAEATAEVMANSLSRLAIEARLEFLSGLSDEVGGLADEMETIRDNVETALDLEKKSLEAADGADALLRLTNSRVAEEVEIRAGLTVEEMAALRTNLTNFSNGVRDTFRKLQSLTSTLDKKLGAVEEMASQISKLRFAIIFQEVNDAAAKSESKP